MDKEPAVHFSETGTQRSSSWAAAQHAAARKNGEPGLVPTPSIIPLISAGAMARRGLPAPVVIEETFSAEPEFATVRWAVNFSSRSWSVRPNV